MKNLGEKVFKKIAAIILILSMIISYLPLSVFAQTESDEEEIDLDNFQLIARWASGNEVETQTALSDGATATLEYGVVFNGVQTGFRNVKLYIETDKVDNIRDYVTTANSTQGNGYAMVNYGKVDTGTSVSGGATVRFGNPEELMERTVTVRVTGVYTDKRSNDQIPFSYSKKLKAVITPSTKNNVFRASLNWQGTSTQYKPHVDRSIEYLENNRGWYATQVEAVFPLDIDIGRYTQKADLQITFNGNINTRKLLEEDYTIDWDGLDTEFLGTPTKTVNPDGSITYTFSKGEDADVLNKENTFYTGAYGIRRVYAIKFKVPTPNTNPDVLENPDDFFSCNFEAKLDAIGFSVTKEYGKEEEITKQNYSRTIYDRETTSLVTYTPGQHAWREYDYYSAYIGDSAYITDSVLEKLKNDGQITINTEIWKSSQSDGGDAEYQYGKINIQAPTLYYVDENGRTQSKTLNENQIKVETVRSDTKSDFIKGTEITEFTSVNPARPQENINVFSIGLKDFLYIYYTHYYITYTLNYANLGLTDYEFNNIQSIEFSAGTTGQWIYGVGTYNIKRAPVYQKNEYSYMMFSGYLDTSYEKLNKSEFGSVSIFMNSLDEEFQDDDDDNVYEKNVVVNENPVFYIELPSVYKYSNFDVSLRGGTNLSIDEEELDIIKKSGVQYLVIPCIGTYNSEIDGSVTIDITFKKTLINPTSTKYTMNAYMITENENYYNRYKQVIANSHEFSNGESTPEMIFRDGIGITVTGASELKAYTAVIVDDIEYQPNDEDSSGRKENPKIIDYSQDTLGIRSRINSLGDTLTNIEILTRLPFANNTYIDYASEQLIEADYVLPDDFIDKHEGKLKGVAKGEVVSQNSLSSITIKGVYLETSRETDGETVRKLDTNTYKIYYTTEENATFDSTSFVLWDGVTDLSTAKNIKIVLEDENGEYYNLKSNQNIYVDYEITMPDTKGMVASTTAVRYQRVSMDNTEELYSQAAYAINGVTTGTLKVQKKFENYPVGTAPAGGSLENIEFKLQYYDETTGQREFLKDSSNNDITATTNAQGIATFDNIPAGDYYLYETTTFTNYDGIGKIELVTIGAAEYVEYTTVNPLKRGKIIVNKKWEDTNDNQGKVKFKLTRVNGANEEFYFSTRTAETDDNGTAIFDNVPYGNYKVTEVSEVNGWTPEQESIDVALSAAEVSADFNNIRSRGILQIVKSVPNGENVDGLTFHVSGRGVLAYTNKDGDSVTTDSDYTIKIGETYPENVTVVKSADNTSATITISNVFMGLYSIEEVDIPTLGDTGIEKYVSVRGEALIDKNDLVNAVTVNLSNRYKTGYLVINKTAKLKEGTNYSDIGDLSGFKVHVTGTSYYGNDVDTMIQLDENGTGFTRLEIGEYTVSEVPVDGYTAYYGTDSNASTEPVRITIQNNKDVTQNLYNEHTGVGYVRVEKKLETVTDVEKVKNAGIKFAVVGQNVAGGRVNEIIEINQIDEAKNVAYGVSGPISVGGEYELQEIESTVPEFYEGMAPESIEITTENTLVKPLTKAVTNARGRGDLEIVTTTNPEGGPLKGITYKVTEVELGENGTYTKIGTTKEIEGSNEDFNTSFAELENIYSGYYLVEQDNIPEGWVKDVSQIVEVPVSNTGYANFEITTKKKLKENKVTINKVILNEAGEVATEEEIEAAKLDVNESFEMKITNVNTQEEYYVFTSAANPGVIQGLDAGTYKVEEITKPKYTTEGYYKTVEVENPVQGLEPLQAIEKINATEGSYLFEITESGNRVEDVTLTVKNKIDTSYGFGGQTHIDNLSKEHAEEETVTYVTKAVIYVVDENANAISGVKFNLINSAGNKVTLNNNTEFEVANKKLIVKGLPVGTYTLKCTTVPEGYLVPDDEKVVVYGDATQVARVEIQKNIPRGSLTLSTTYKTDKGVTKYLPRSKYKVVDKDTGELVKFVRTSTGDYKKSNLDDASPVIVLKAGTVEVEGIETGDYEVGIVDVTKGYGIQKLTVEDVTVEQNVNKDVNVEVISNNIVKVDAGQATSMYLTESGELYVKGYGYYGAFGDGNSSSVYSSQFKKIEFPISNVKITKFVHDYYGTLAIDSEGRIWTWGSDSTGRLLGTSTSSSNYSPTCVTELGVLYDEYYNEGTRFVDVQANAGTSLLLDNKGRVWAAGNYTGDGDSNYDTVKLIDTFENIEVKKLAKLRSDQYSANLGVIDSLGRVWMWGSTGTSMGVATASYSYSPVCLSTVSTQNPTTPLENVVIEDLLINSKFVMAIDSDGNLWLWGTAGEIQATMTQGVKVYPTKVDSSYFDGAKIKALAGISGSQNNNAAAVIDEYGRLWTWGANTSGETGNGTSSGVPVCITDDEPEMLYGVEIKDIEFSDSYYADSMTQHHVIAVDTNNRLWAWGGKSYYGEAGAISASPIFNPQRMDATYNEHFEYNLKFKQVVSSTYNYNKFAIDDEGRVWVWGDNYRNSLGIYNSGYSINTPTVLDIPGSPKITKISSAEYNTLMLSEDGRVYIAGYGYLGNGTKVGNGIGITEITKNFELPADVYIKDITSIDYSGILLAVDSEGKVYTWGDSTSMLGRTGSSDAKKIECISDDSNEPLNGISIRKISGTSSVIYAIADDGKLYSWHSGETPALVECRAKFVDGNKEVLLDDEGKVWSTYGSSVQCITDITSNALYKNYQVDSNYKITNLYDHEYIGAYAVLKDSNGEWWYVSSGSTIYKYEVPVKDVISLSCKILVDRYGQIWQIDGNNATCLSNTEENPVYNVKMKKILSDGYVADDKGNRWSFYNYNNPPAVKDGISPIEYIEGTLGVNLVQKCYVYEDKQIALDDQGNIWQGDYSGVKCLSTVEGSAFASKYEDENYRVNKIYYTITGSNGSSTYFALDNQGKLWQWNYGQNPICVNEISGCDLADNVELEFVSGYSGSANSTYYKNIILAKDDNGNMWTWGENTNGVCGNGNTNSFTKPYHINTSALDGKAIKYFTIKFQRGLIVCEDGSVYVSGDSAMNDTTKWTLMGVCEGADKGFIVSSEALYVITGENKVWTFGRNCRTSSWSYKGACGTLNLTDEFIKVPALISESFTVAEMVCDDVGNGIAIDTNGNVWIWRETTRPVKVEGLNNIVTTIIPYSSRSTGAVIDINGVVHRDCYYSRPSYTYYYNNSNETTYDNSQAIKDMYGVINRENIIKLTDLTNDTNNRNRTINVIINGKLWEVKVGRDGEIESYKCISESLGSEMQGKTIVDNSTYKALDSEGNLYAWSQGTGLNYTLSYPKNITKTINYSDSSIKANNTVTNIPSANRLYGIKVSELINDRFVKDENGDFWYFTISGEPVNISEKHRGDKNPLYGKQIARTIGNSNQYVVTTDNEIWYVGGEYPGYVMNAYSGEYDYIYEDFNNGKYYIVLDKNGNILTCGTDANGKLGNGGYTTNNELICLNDIEGSALYEAKQNDSNFKISKILYVSYNVVYALDNSGKLWVWGSGANQLTPICVTNAEGCALNTAYTENGTLIVKYENGKFRDNENYLWKMNGDALTWEKDGTYLEKITGMTLYMNGKIHIENPIPTASQTSYADFSQINALSNIKNIYLESTSNSYYSTYETQYQMYYFVCGESGAYHITYNYRYNRRTNTITYENYSLQERSTDSFTKCVQTTTSDGRYVRYFMLNQNKEVWVDGITGITVDDRCSSSPMYGKQIEDIEKIGNTVLMTDSDGILYAAFGIGNDDSFFEPCVFTQYDEIITRFYGEATNETRKQFVNDLNAKKLTDSNITIFAKDGKTYELKFVDKQLVCNEISYTSEYVNGLGNLDSVVGEFEVKAEDGKIYRFTPDGVDSYTLSEVTETTEFSTATPDETVTLDGINVVKQTAHKALDDKGNLYVWGDYTGLVEKPEDATEVVSLTETEYSIKPIYLRSNGWSIISAGY
ncbi:MAG: hypothetical protein IJ890_08280 [Clostridia bacterium]|nr:hypothetical protein [Clostridia bacterium]